MATGRSGNPQNAPATRPPRDVKLAPSDYLVTTATVTAVTTSRPSPDPFGETAPGAIREPGRKDPSVFVEQDRGFQSEVEELPPPKQEGDPLAAGTAAGCPLSIFANARGDGKVVAVAETCKFSPVEVERLLKLRRRFVSCSAELEALCEAIAADGGTESGLPRLKETYRSHFGGDTFSVEDAQRELCNTWLVGKLKQYASFVDAALADELDPPRGGHREVGSVASRNGPPAVPPRSGTSAGYGGAADDPRAAALTAEGGTMPPNNGGPGPPPYSLVSLGCGSPQPWPGQNAAP